MLSSTNLDLSEILSVGKDFNTKTSPPLTLHHLVLNFYTHASKKRGVYWFSSVRPSVHNQYFRHTLLSNHASQPLQTWYGALAMGPTRHLPKSGRQGIFFLFSSSVHFWTLHLGMAGVYSVNKNSQTSW